MKVASKENTQVKGIVTRRLFSREKFYNLLVENGVIFSYDFWTAEANDSIRYELKDLFDAGINAGLDNDLVAALLDKSAKKQFADNAVWRFLKRNFDVDLALPFITGNYTTKMISRNLVTTRGKQVVAERIGGTGSQGAVTAIAIGIGVTAPAAGDTALGTESTTNGAARGAATVTNVTTTTTLDTEQWVKTFTFTGTFAITEEGLFDNNASGGVMLARQTFSAVNVVSGDSLQITHQVKVS